MLDDIADIHELIADARPRTLAGAAVLLSRALAAIEAHDCRSPWREPERVEGRLVEPALGVIEASFRAGKIASVWVDETRPLLQGARLTAWELKRLGIPFRVLPDSAAGALMSRGEVDRIVVGADRIAANGDVANKIGTYTVAVLAERHGVPFYVAAPLSTIDLETPSGDAIPIETRSPDEVVEIFGTRVVPDDTSALNLAFDVTPSELIAAIVTEQGVLRSPFSESIPAAFSRSRS